MTPEERIDAAFKRLYAKINPYAPAADLCATVLDDARNASAEAITTAVADERRRCAEVALTLYEGGEDASDFDRGAIAASRQIADAIERTG